MRMLLWAVAGLVGGYALGAFLGFAAVTMLAGNTHDKSVEAAVTGCLVLGPIVALVGVIAGIAIGWRS